MITIASTPYSTPNTYRLLWDAAKGHPLVEAEAGDATWAETLIAYLKEKSPTPAAVVARLVAGVDEAARLDEALAIRLLTLLSSEDEAQWRQGIELNRATGGWLWEPEKPAPPAPFDFIGQYARSALASFQQQLTNQLLYGSP